LDGKQLLGVGKMRYELRRWTDNTKTDYVVRQLSDDRDAIEAQLKRVLTASSEPNLNHIVDTIGEYDD